MIAACTGCLDPILATPLQLVQTALIVLVALALFAGAAVAFGRFNR